MLVKRIQFGSLNFGNIFVNKLFKCVCMYSRKISEGSEGSNIVIKISCFGKFYQEKKYPSSINCDEITEL